MDTGETFLSQLSHCSVLFGNEESACLINPFKPVIGDLCALEHPSALEALKEIVRVVVITDLRLSVFDIAFIHDLSRKSTLVAPSHVLMQLPVELKSQFLSVQELVDWTALCIDGFRVTGISGLSPKHPSVHIAYGDSKIWYLGSGQISSDDIQRLRYIESCQGYAILNVSFFQGLRLAVGADRSFPYEHLKNFFAQLKKLSIGGIESFFLVGGLSYLGRASWKNNYEFPVARENFVQMIENQLMSPVVCGWKDSVSFSSKQTSISAKYSNLSSSNTACIYQEASGIPPMLGCGEELELSMMNSLRTHFEHRISSDIGNLLVRLMQELDVVVELRIVEDVATYYMLIDVENESLQVSKGRVAPVPGRIINTLYVAVTAKGLSGLLSGHDRPYWLALEDQLRLSFNPLLVNTSPVVSAFYATEMGIMRSSSCAFEEFLDAFNFGYGFLLDFICVLLGRPQL